MCRPGGCTTNWVWTACSLCNATSTATMQRLCQTLVTGDTAGWTAQLLQWLHADQLCHARADPAPAMGEPAVQQALQCLHQHPDAAPSVQDLAAAGGMSPSRFIRHFKAATGVTPGAYRLNLRLNGARHLLAQGVALADAAHAMGFADQAHLQRSFKAHHALTPGRYAQPQAH